MGSACHEGAWSEHEADVLCGCRKTEVRLGHGRKVCAESKREGRSRSGLRYCVFGLLVFFLVFGVSSRLFSAPTVSADADTENTHLTSH